MYSESPIEAYYGLDTANLGAVVLNKRISMLYTVIFIILILALCGAFGTGGYGFGYRATGGLGFLVVLVLALLLIG